MRIEQSIHKSVAALVARGLLFKRVSAAPWVGEIEERLGFRLPMSLRILVTNYTYPAMEIGEVELLSNLGEESEGDLTVTPFADKGLFKWLQANQRFHFARPSTGSYDPVCLEARGRHSAAVERLDHEDILMCRNKVRSTTLAASLEEMLQRAAA